VLGVFAADVGGVESMVAAAVAAAEASNVLGGNAWPWTSAVR